MAFRKLAIAGSLLIVMFSLTLTSFAQDSATAVSTTAGSVVPGLVNYSGVLKDASGKILTGVNGVTFLLYKEELGGAPVWIETQNVMADKNGHYTVTLGATKTDGSLADSFANGEARWLEVQVAGQAEQARVLMVAVPYALKAGDAETIGGLRPSAFMLASGIKGTGAGTNTVSSTSTTKKTSTPPVNPNVTGVGTVDFIPMWDTTSDIVNSVLFQKSSQIGIATTTPGATLDVNGKSDVRDTLTLFPKSTDNTLAVNGTAFNVSSTGAVTFIGTQTFPGTGTITGITTASGSGLQGGGTKGALTLSVKPTGVTNAMLQNSKVTIPVTAPLTGGGAVSLGASATVLALKPCAANQVYLSSGTAWNCAAAGTGTITGITTASGSGLHGGGTSGTLNLSVASGGITNAMLQNNKVTVTAGTDLTGGGVVSLGGTTTLNVDTTKVPQLGAANAFNGAQTINGLSSAVALTVDSSGNLSEPQVEIIQNNTSDFARLRFTDAGSANYWDIAGVVGTTPQLNFWNGTAAINVLQLSPTSVQANTNLNIVNGGATDGIDISAGGDGIYIASVGSGLDGVVSYGSFDGGYFNGTSAGVAAYSETDSALDAGVLGFEYGSTTETVGVYGYSASTVGLGVYGQAVDASVTGANSDGGRYPMGVWGDSGQQYGFGVFGSADDGWAFVGYNNSPSGFATAWLENLENTANDDPVLFAYGGSYGGTCTADVSGNLTCSGSVSAAAPVDGGARKVALNGIQSPEHWFEDVGGGQLSNGEATVSIESVYGQTVNTGVDYHVFLTPNGDCKGLFVAQKSATSFVVRELGGGTSSIAFDYRIIAKRRGFEQVRLLDKTEALSLNHRPNRSAGQPVKPVPTAKQLRQQMEEHAKPHPAAVKPTVLSKTVSLPVVNNKK